MRLCNVFFKILSLNKLRSSKNNKENLINLLILFLLLLRLSNSNPTYGLKGKILIQQIYNLYMSSLHFLNI